MLWLRSLPFSPFFSCCSGAHRHLPSFPTRRSSDLQRHREEDLAQLPGERSLARRIARSRRQHDHAAARQERLRSEEHTSELQSPCNLVCRLLLEKKKQDNRVTTTAR